LNSMFFRGSEVEYGQQIWLKNVQRKRRNLIHLVFDFCNR
jgi:hypothetical protein